MGFKRKYLSADGLIRLVRQALDKERFKPCRRSAYTWQDCIMSCLAVFGFKFPSLLQFEKAKADEPRLRRNLRTLYGVTQAPSDTCMRERLDQLTPAQLRRPFKRIFACLQRGKVLEQFAYLGGHYIVSLDGTGQYASKKVHCQNCCEKKHRNGDITYYHHMVGAAIVHPDHKAVIPLAPEPIVKGDGANKNDCERNASRRLLQDLRREHPHLKALIVEDGLASNFPHLSLLDSLNMPYIIGVKPGDHGYLFDWIGMMEGETHQYTDSNGTLHAFHYYHDVPLSDAHSDYRVNVLRYWETKSTGQQQRFSWVTSLPLSSATVTEVMRAGRARWRIENETFNTLKNQGYHFEHNYGHGYANLCSVMTMLMMLAFLIDQVQQLCCQIYQTARAKEGRLSALFERVRSMIHFYIIDRWETLYRFIGEPKNRPPPDEWGYIKMDD